MSTIDSKKYVLMISHVMPIPPAAGNEISILKVLKFLKRNGYSTIFLLNQKYADKNSILELKEYVEEVFISTIDPSKVDGKVVAPSVEFLSKKNQNKKDLCPPELVFLTSVLCKKYNPVAVIAQYVFTSPCLDVVSAETLKIIDTHDMFSRRNSEEILYCTPEEERDYLLKSDLVIAIQNDEAEMFRQLVPERKVIVRGLDYDIPDKVNDKEIIPGSVLVIGSDNEPNVKGLTEFASEAWPMVKKSIPNAQLKVIGKVCNNFRSNDPSIQLLGFVKDLEPEYRKAAIVINTTSIGTGLKVKTVEALCHGKAFIGTPNSVEGLPESELKPFISCKDWETFSSAIISMLGSNQKRSELEKRAISYSKKQFSYQNIWGALLKELNQHAEALDEARKICPVCKTGKFERYGDLHWNIWNEEYKLVQCQECESIFTDPIPTDETLTKFYSTEFNYNWYRDHYGAKLLDCQDRIKEYKDYLGKRVLDYGGGLGYFSQVARSEGYHSITFDPYVENDIIQEKDWDTIVTLHVLEHSNDLDRTIDLMKGYLSPGGNLVLVVPNAKSNGYKKLGMNWVWAQPPLLHLFHFTAKGLKALLERHGFNIQDISYHERWDANLYTDLEKVREFQQLDSEWGSEEVKKDSTKRALTAWRNSSLRVNGLKIALQNYQPKDEKYAELQIIASTSKKNQVKIGLMNKDNPDKYDAETVCFQISKYDLSFTQIFYSAFATPARYIMEMYIRLFSIGEKNNSIIVFNPFFLISNEVYEKVKAQIISVKDYSEIIVFADSNEIPIAYLFPNDLPFYDARYLSFLSAMYAELDAELLKNIFLIKSKCIYLKDVLLDKKKDNNGFNYNNDYDRVYSWITDSALKTLYKKHGRNFSNNDIDALNNEDKKILNGVKHTIPCDVLMPHHAGDALFLALALKNSISFINKVVISSWYKDIIEDSIPDIKTFPIDVTPCFRDNNNKPDEVMFWEVISKLKGTDMNESFHYFFRPSREYRISDFHLTDHFYFAVGASINSRDDLLTSHLVPENYLPARNGDSSKVLIHFEGGWPIKTYPQNYLNELIKLLHNKGYEITLLSSHHEKSKLYNVVKYTNLSDYKKLLASHNLLIGMDSFPVHYGAHAAGTPTICIFGNTKPVNSDAPISKFYNYVYGELKCAGCFGFDRCPLNNKTTCDNFPKPEEIFETAVKMLDELYNANPTAIEEKEKEAAALINDGKFSEAIESIESVLDSSPDAHDAHFLLGRLNEIVNNSDKAIFHYEKAVTLNHDNIMYEKTLADYYHFKLEKTDEALDKYLGILRKQPSNTNVLILVGNILALGGHSLEASKYYSQALVYEPGNQIAIENLMSLPETNRQN